MLEFEDMMELRAGIGLGTKEHIQGNRISIHACGDGSRKA
jgi:hypothetical protein